MANAGEFNKTVMLHSFTENAKDALGHKARSYSLVRKCAARVWARSAQEIANAPADFPAVALRLLLLLPPRATFAVGWRITYDSLVYEVKDLEWRENDTQALVSLERA
jgi:hypothetical protein